MRLGQACTYSDEEPYQNSSSSSSDRKRGEASMGDLSDRMNCLENQMADVAQTLRKCDLQPFIASHGNVNPDDKLLCSMHTQVKQLKSYQA